MKYLCLRDCFVNSVLWRQGLTYNLPNDMEKSEKNFKPLPEATESPIEAVEEITEVTPSVETEITLEVVDVPKEEVKISSKRKRKARRVR